LTDEDDDKELSPAEQRALKAEKRAAWRQARLKSLEQVKICFTLLTIQFETFWFVMLCIVRIPMFWRTMLPLSSG
jgi:hypothetical protein